MRARPRERDYRALMAAFGHPGLLKPGARCEGCGVTLTAEELAEPQAIRLAHVHDENLHILLRDDRGGFDGDVTAPAGWPAQ